MINKIQQTIATLGFIGYLPYIPGTFGSALSLLAVILLMPSDSELLMFFLPIVLLGLITSHTAEKSLGKDSKYIVIDEFSGYLLSVFFVPKTIGYLLAAFILFRIFDILKPPPIRKTEKLSGGAGIIIDDLIAALYANVCIQLWRYLFVN